MNTIQSHKKLWPWLTFLMLIVSASCTKSKGYPDLGLGIAYPIDIALSPDGQYYYVLNSDIDRRYDEGSILILDKDGNRLSAIPTPRLGRSLTVSEDNLIVTFDGPGEDEEGSPKVHLYNIENPENPTLERSWEIECNPLNAVKRSGYQYFAVSCLGGFILVGEITADKRESTLQVVRKMGPYTRRAMHIDPERGLLFAFVTDLGVAGLRDEENVDEFSYTVTVDEETNEEIFTETSGANDIPDRFESSAKNVRSSRNLKRRFQYLVYDIEAEAEKGFPDLGLEDEEFTDVELRWMYFNLTDIDGSPDREAWEIDQTKKYYRTNFWKALPDPADPNVFYLSHRGLEKKDGSPDANQIVKVTITGDPRPQEEAPQDEEQDAQEGQETNKSALRKTSDIVKFERIYGFKGDQKRDNDPNYPGDFEILYSQGQRTLIVNNFRDLSNFREEGGARFTVTAAALDDSYWFEELQSTSGKTSYYQLAASRDGRVLTGSFYGSALILLEIKPGVAITELKRIE